MIRTSRVFSDERGGVATLVAMFMAFGVVLGMASLSIDTGKLMFERRELQNAADAGAMSLAQSCARNKCSAGAEGTLTSLSAGNAKDGLHAIAGQCAMNTTTSLSGCPTGDVDPMTSKPYLEQLAQCPPIDPAKKNLSYVEVRTKSLASDGGPVTNLFARATGGADTTTVHACARAAWGTPGGATVLPLTFSKCEFHDAMKVAGFHDPSLGIYHGEVALATMYKSGYSPCPGDTKMDGPGAFGWIGDGACSVQEEDGWVPGDPGQDPILGCFKPGDTVLIPIYNEFVKSGKLYHIDGFAAFYITGYQFPKTKLFALPDYPGDNAKLECEKESQNKKFCLFGWFVGDYVDGSGPIDPDGTPYGVLTVQPMG